MDARERIEAMLGPGVSPGEAILEHLPGVHLAQIDEYRRVSSVPLLVSVYFDDAEERYCFELSGEGAEVERGEAVEFPVATIVARASQWDRVRPLLLSLSLSMDASREALRARAKRQLDDAARRAWGKLRGTVAVVVRDEAGEVGSFEVALNEYEPDPSAPRVEIGIERATLESLARGALDPSDLGGHVTLGGSVGLGMSLAGFFAKYLL